MESSYTKNVIIAQVPLPNYEECMTFANHGNSNGCHAVGDHECICTREKLATALSEFRSREESEPHAQASSVGLSTVQHPVELPEGPGVRFVLSASKQSLPRRRDRGIRESPADETMISPLSMTRQHRPRTL